MYRCVETGLDEKVELDHVSSLVEIRNKELELKLERAFSWPCL